MKKAILTNQTFQVWEDIAKHGCNFNKMMHFSQYTSYTISTSTYGIVVSNSSCTLYLFLLNSDANCWSTQKKLFMYFEKGFLHTCAAGWVTLCPLSIVNAKRMMHDVFGLATETFQDNLSNPVAGFLEITFALFPLEWALLFFALTSTLTVGSKVEISAQDWFWIVAALMGVVSATMGALLLAASLSDFQVTNSTLLGSFVILTLLTGTMRLHAAEDMEDPILLFKADTSELLMKNDASSPTAQFFDRLVLWIACHKWMGSSQMLEQRHLFPCNLGQICMMPLWHSS